MYLHRPDMFYLLLPLHGIAKENKPEGNHNIEYFAWIVFTYLSAAICLRGYVSNHLPLSNGFETMQFMAWCTLLLTFLLQRKFAMLLPFGFLLCGLTLMVSMLGESNPQITQLMPVLQSPLLSIHVVVIMIAYSLLAFIMLNGVTAVILHQSQKECKEQIERLQIISQIILYPAIFLLAIGIFIGAVWANVSGDAIGDGILKKYGP